MKKRLTWIYALPNFILIFLIMRMLKVQVPQACQNVWSTNFCPQAHETSEILNFYNTSPCGKEAEV
jgi:hypothetical protein